MEKKVRRIDSQRIEMDQNLRNNASQILENGDYNEQIPLSVVENQFEALGYSTRTMNSIHLLITGSNIDKVRTAEIKTALIATHTHGMNSIYEVVFRSYSTTFAYLYFDIRENSKPKQRLSRRKAKSEEVSLLSRAVNFVLKEI